MMMARCDEDRGPDRPLATPFLAIGPAACQAPGGRLDPGEVQSAAILAQDWRAPSG